MKELKPTKKSRIYEIIMLGICILICAGAFVFGVWSLNSITSSFDTSGQISYKGFADNYTPIDYIQSYGSQYIDTGVEYDNTVKVEIDFKPNTISTASNALNIVVLGSVSNYTNTSFQVVCNDDVYGAGTNKLTTISSSYRSTFEALPVRTSAIITSTSAVVSTELKTTSLENWKISENISGTIKLLHQFENNLVKIYSCKIYKNNKLVRDYIPCYKNSTDENGLYDIVNSTFTTSATSTGFAREIPADYFTYKVAGITLANPQGTNEKIDMAYITGMTKTWDKDYFVLPEKLGGYEVFSLEFENSTTLNSSIYIMPNSFAWWASASGVDLLTFGNSQVKLIAPSFWHLSETNLNKVTEAFVIDNVTAGTFRTTSGYFKGATNLSKVRFANNTYEIPDNAFKDCTSLSDIKLPLRLLSIRDNAFQNCSGLQSISIPRYTRYISSSAFANTANLTNGSSVQSRHWLKDSETADKYEQVNSLNAEALHSGKTLRNKCIFTYEGNTITGLDSNYSYFTELTIPSNYYYASSSKDSTTGRYNFYYASFSSVGDSAFKNNTTITTVSTQGAYISSLGSEAFRGCTALTTVKISTGDTTLKTIGTWAFGGCSSLTDFPFENLQSLTTLGDSCFNFTALTNVKFNNKAPLSIIDNAIFYSVESLKTVQLNSNIKTISNNMFYNCNALTSVTGGDAVVSIGENAFSPAAGTGTLATCEPLLSGNLQTINAYAFNNQPLLEYSDLTFSSNLANIKEYAFNGCAKLSGSINLESTQLTEISDGAFSGCSNLTSITLPSALTAIGSYAFENCADLKSITIPSTITTIGYRAYYGTGILSATFSDTLGWCVKTSSTGTADPIDLSSSALSNALRLKSTYTNYYWEKVANIFTYSVNSDNTTASITGLVDKFANVTRIVIPKSIDGYTITAIADSAFASKKLKDVEITSSSLLSIGNNAFQDCLITTIDFTGATNLKTIGGYAFSGCKFETINLRNNTSLTYVGNAAFHNNSALKTAYMPYNLTNNSNYAASTFHSCTSLQTVYLSENMTEICNAMFYSCSSLSKIGIVKSNNISYDGNLLNITSIAASAFENCSSLTSFTFPSALTTLGVSAFKFSGLKGDTLDLSVCTKLTEIPIMCFFNLANNTGFTTVKLPTSIKVIAEKAFYNNTSLASINLKELTSLTTIGVGAFNNCSSLTDVYIPSGVTSIGYTAFANTGLQTANFANRQGWAVRQVDLTTNQEGSTVTGLDLIKIVVDASEFGQDFTDTFANYLKSTYYDCNWTLETVFTYETNSDFDGITITGLKEYFKNIQYVTINDSEDGYRPTRIADNAFKGAIQFNRLYIYSTYLHTIGAYAFDCTVYELDIIDNNIISTIGDYAFANVKDTIDFSNMTQLRTIGNYAFSGCPYTTIDLRNSTFLSSIGMYAFSSNSILKTVYMPYNFKNYTSLSIFNGCPNLTSVYLSQATTSIAAEMFFNCPSLSTVGIVQSNKAYTTGTLTSLTSIGSRAFEGCGSLTSFGFSSTIESLGAKAFLNAGLTGTTLDLSACTKLTAIPEGCFYQIGASTGYQTVKLPTSIKTIGDDAFYNNKSLTTLDLSAMVNLETISQFAFSGCSFTTLNLSNSTKLTYVGNAAFHNNAGLTIAYMPYNLTNYAASTFNTCPNLTTAYLSENLTEICFAMFFSCTNLSKLGITKSDNYCYDGNFTKVTKIGEQAFEGCSSLTNWYFPNVETISNKAFTNCSSFTEINFGSNLTSIGTSAFQFCSGLTTIYIPATIEYIGPYAFHKCTSLIVANPDTSIAGPYTDFNLIGCKKLQVISNSCFAETGIRRLMLPASVNKIDTNAFFNCTALTTVIWYQVLAQNTKTFTISVGAFTAAPLTSFDVTDIMFSTISARWNIIDESGNYKVDESGNYVVASITSQTQLVEWIKNNNSSAGLKGVYFGSIK